VFARRVCPTNKKGFSGKNETTVNRVCTNLTIIQGKEHDRTQDVSVSETNKNEKRTFTVT
jgi:hypothetical protein